MYIYNIIPLTRYSDEFDLPESEKQELPKVWDGRSKRYIEKTINGLTLGAVRSVFIYAC